MTYLKINILYKNLQFNNNTNIQPEEEFWKLILKC